MTSENEDRKDLYMEYLRQDQPDNGQDNKQMESSCEETKTPTLRKLKKAQANDRSCNQTALTVALTKFTFTFDTKGELVQALPIDGASQ